MNVSTLNEINISMSKFTLLSPIPRVLASAKEDMSADYLVENPTGQMMALQVSCDFSDRCAFAGRKQCRIQLAPYTSQILCYKFLALLDEEPSNRLRLPKLEAINEITREPLQIMTSTAKVSIDDKAILYLAL